MIYHIERNREREFAITKDGERLFTLTVRQLVEMLAFGRAHQQVIERMRVGPQQEIVEPYIDIYLHRSDGWLLTVRHHASGGVTVNVSKAGEPKKSINQHEVTLVLTEVLHSLLVEEGDNSGQAID